MNYGIKNIRFDRSSSEVEGTADVGKKVINFRYHAGGKTWEAWREGAHRATVVFSERRDKALRAARKHYALVLTPL